MSPPPSAAAPPGPDPRTGGDSDSPPAACLVGVISDTHGLLDPRVAPVFAGVAHILHAGDIGGPEVLEGLGRIAPVTAVRGNTDQGPLAWDLPQHATVEVCGVRFLVAHDLGALLRVLDIGTAGVDVVVTGHSHAPSVRWEGGILFLNPGAAGRRRFHLPKAVALVGILPGEGGGDRIRPHIEILEPGAPAR